VKGEWPGGLSTDPAVSAARHFSTNLAQAVAGMSLREAARVSGVAHTTIKAIIDGRVWGDIYTLAQLEAAFGPLWR
jgi:plasmid maintenance system antidote protein VapI